MEPVRIIRTEEKPQRLPDGSRVLWRRIWHLEVTPETHEFIRSLLDDIENHFVSIDGGREELRRVGFPAEFVWASRPGEEPFEIGDGCVMHVPVTSTRVYTGVN